MIKPAEWNQGLLILRIPRIGAYFLADFFQKGQWFTVVKRLPTARSKSPLSPIGIRSSSIAIAGKFKTFQVAPRTRANPQNRWHEAAA